MKAEKINIETIALNNLKPPSNDNRESVKEQLQGRISEVNFGYNAVLEVYTQLTADINTLSEMPKPAMMRRI